MDVIHSDLSNQARTAAINRFRTGETWVLIATDLLGRGLPEHTVSGILYQNAVDFFRRSEEAGTQAR